VPFVLSVLDQSPISEGSTGADALRNSIDLARHTEELGYERYWVAEHHGTPMLASAAPEILIAEIAGATSRIRVGSGGVMLPRVPALGPEQVAEEYGADELMLVTITHDHAARRRSYELVAGAF
jgi:hypothetical protein